MEGRWPHWTSIGNDLRDYGDAQSTDALNDAGTGTVLTWPAHATYGDNFT